MTDLSQSKAANSKNVAFSTGYGLGCQLLLSQSPIDHFFRADDQPTHWFIVIWASSLVQMEISSDCTFSCTCCWKMHTPILHAIEWQNHTHESYQILTALVLNLSAERSNGICNIWASGNLCQYQNSNHQLVNGRITGLFLGHPLMNLHHQSHGNWSRVIMATLYHHRPKVALLIDTDHIILLIAFDYHTEIEEDPPEIAHVESLFQLILYLVNQTMISSDDEVIEIPNDWLQLFPNPHQHAWTVHFRYLIPGIKSRSQTPQKCHTICVKTTVGYTMTFPCRLPSAAKCVLMLNQSIGSQFGANENIPVLATYISAVPS